VARFDRPNLSRLASSKLRCTLAQAPAQCHGRKAVLKPLDHIKDVGLRPLNDWAWVKLTASSMTMSDDSPVKPNLIAVRDIFTEFQDKHSG
jgi:hypothetical protein